MKIVRIYRRRVLAMSMVLSLGFTANAQRNVFSNSGKYMAVIIADTAGGSECVIQSTFDKWSQQFDAGRIENFQFSNDDNWAFYLNGSSLQINKMHSNEIDSISGVSFFNGPGVEAYKLQPKTANDFWVACMLCQNQLLLYNLDKKNRISFRNTLNYQFAPNGKGVLFTQIDTVKSMVSWTISWLDLTSETSFKIWDSRIDAPGSKPVEGFFFDNYASQLAFSVADAKGKRSIWRWQLISKRSKLLITDSMINILFPSMTLDGIPILGFNLKGDRMLFLATEHILKTPDSAIIKASENLDLWSYFDPVNMPYQKKFLSDRNYIISFSISDQKMTKLENKREIIPKYQDGGTLPRNPLRFLGDRLFESHGLSANDQVIVFQWKGDILYTLDGRVPKLYLLSEADWSDANKVSIYLESIRDGSRKLLKADMKRSSSEFPFFTFSPDGKYIIYFDEELGQYISYQTSTGIKVNISENLFVSFRVRGGYHSAVTRALNGSKGIVGWAKDGTKLLVYDSYTDVWLFDPSGKSLPLNLTRSFCKSNDYEIKGTAIGYSTNNILDVDEKKRLLLYIRDNKTGEFGLIYLDVTGKSAPELRLMDKHNIRLFKSVRSGSFVVSRETNTSSRRYYITKNYGKTISPFDKINSVIKKAQPALNWTKDILGWKTFSGRTALGALYKPLDFKATRKYPVLFLCYEDAYLYTLEAGAPGGGGLSIDDVIARGYLVFVPDIRYVDTSKTSLESAYDYVVSGAKYLSTLPYIQADKMGLTGHSFGAMETNYIITHTIIFAAAFSSAGRSDYVSSFGTEENDGGGFPFDEAGGQAGLIGNVWNNRENYLDNSAVFNADKVETPLLMVANQDDDRVPSSQGVEFFKCLRRLGKIVWMLRYPHGGHGYPKDADIREMQFFDYYLKGMPPPVWMTRGIPASMKGHTLGLEIDSTMQAPPPPLTIKGQ